MLIPIPWQPSLMVHADLLAKLQAVRSRLGRDPMLYSDMSAWRSFDQQQELYKVFLAGQGPVASNPTTGNRTHMRGVAADLRETSNAMQQACVAVGLQRDPAEAWHWQLPSWRDYPIINELPNPQEDDMAQGAFFRNTTTGYVYWQEKPNTPLMHISAPTWAGYKIQGNKWADLTAADVDGLIAKWGEVDAPIAIVASAGAAGVSAEDVADELADRLRE